MSFKGFCNHLFIAFTPTHQIDTQNTRIFLCQPFKMFNKRIISKLIIARYFALSSDSHLLPECWHTTSDLHLRQTIPIIKDHLFSFYKIGHIAFIINPSMSISSPCSFFWPSTDQNVFQFLTIYISLDLTNVSLY